MRPAILDYAHFEFILLPNKQYKCSMQSLIIATSQLEVELQ